jgi:hypothetical protein
MPGLLAAVSVTLSRPLPLGIVCVAIVGRGAHTPTGGFPVGGTSSSMIVSTAVFWAPTVPPPPGLVNVTMTVSSGSSTASFWTGTEMVFVVSPAPNATVATVAM